MNIKIAIVLLVVLLSSGCGLINISDEHVGKPCIDNCPFGYICYHADDIPKSHECGTEQGDCYCHKLCKTDNDCTKETPQCDVIETTGNTKMCF